MIGNGEKGLRSYKGINEVRPYKERIYFINS